MKFEDPCPSCGSCECGGGCVSAPVSGTHDYGVHQDDRLTKDKLARALEPDLFQHARMTIHFMHWLRRESMKRDIPPLSEMDSMKITDLVEEFYYGLQDI